MKAIGSIIALSLLFTLPAALASEQSIRAGIEKRQRANEERDGSTSGTVDAAEKAYSEWDAELNKNYKGLLAKLPSEKARAALKTSQSAWLQFRDKEFQALDQLYGGLEGTMYVPMSVESRIRIVRDRALQLLADYHLLSEDSDPPTLKPSPAKGKQK